MTLAIRALQARINDKIWLSFSHTWLGFEIELGYNLAAIDSYIARLLFTHMAIQYTASILTCYGEVNHYLKIERTAIINIVTYWTAIANHKNGCTLIAFS